MGLIRFKLGDLIEPVYETNSDLALGPESVKGMTITKELIPTRAKLNGTDLSKFIKVEPGTFVFNPRTHGKKIGLSFNDSHETYLISWNNNAFVIADQAKDVIHPIYLFFHFNRGEWDREACFRSWGSSTEVFTWDALFEMEIDLPSIEIQQKYVDIYNALVANQKCYEESLEDLKLACDLEIEKLKNEDVPWVALGDLFNIVDERNSRGQCSFAMGININKTFMESKVSAGEIRNYKLVKPGQFAFSGMQTGRDKCIRIALYDQEDQIAISPAYTVLETMDDTIDSSYLMMLFDREESDRLGWFLSDSSIRSNLDLDRFFEIEVPIPNETIMKSLGNMRKVLCKRIFINERLKAQIKDICPILIKGSLEEAKKA